MTRVSSAPSADRPPLTPRTVALLSEAGLMLAAARLAVVALPFAVLARRLGAHGRESSSDGDPRCERIGWAVEAVACRTPWRSKCLEQAIAAQAMLRRRGITTTLYLGVARSAGGEVETHAWLRNGGVHVTGGAHVARYAIVATYARSAR